MSTMAAPKFMNIVGKPVLVTYTRSHGGFCAVLNNTLAVTGFGATPEAAYYDLALKVGQLVDMSSDTDKGDDAPP